MKHMKQLKEVFLRGLDLVNTNKLLGKAFIECKRLEILDISDNSIELVNQRCLDAIQDLIVNTKRLKHLIMNDVVINEEEGKNFLDSFHMNCTIISWNYEQHPSLKKDTYERIEAELTVNTLIDALVQPYYQSNHPSMLDLSNKKLAKTESIIKFLKCNQHIYDINLENNEFEDVEIRNLIEYLVSRRK